MLKPSKILSKAYMRGKLWISLTRWQTVFRPVRHSRPSPDRLLSAGTGPGRQPRAEPRPLRSPLIRILKAIKYAACSRQFRCEILWPTDPVLQSQIPCFSSASLVSPVFSSKFLADVSPHWLPQYWCFPNVYWHCSLKKRKKERKNKQTNKKLFFCRETSKLIRQQPALLLCPHLTRPALVLAPCNTSWKVHFHSIWEKSKHVPSFSIANFIEWKIIRKITPFLFISYMVLKKRYAKSILQVNLYTSSALHAHILKFPLGYLIHSFIKHPVAEGQCHSLW